jgi:hypothetical protein
MKAIAIGIVGFIVFVQGWYWFTLRPNPTKAIGAGAVRAMITSNPLFWALAFTAAFGCASVYLLVRR